MTDKVDVITAIEAAKILSENGIPMSPDTLRKALQQKIFPWGWSVIEPLDGHVIQTWIVRPKMMAWIAEMKMT